MRILKSTARNLLRGANRIRSGMNRAGWWTGFDAAVGRVEISTYSIPGAQVFFGYYDQNPLAAEGTRLLAHVAGFNLRSPRLSDSLSVGFFERGDSEDADFVQLGTTTAWCWQMGARLRWLDIDGNRAAFNRRSDQTGVLSTALVEARSGELEAELPPLFDLSAEVAIGVTLDFVSLQRKRPGYGYAGNHRDSLEHRRKFGDGICLVNLKDSSAYAAVEVGELAGIQVDDTLRTVPLEDQYLNHPSFSPSGRWLAFLHLAQLGERRYSRLFIMDTVTAHVHLLLPGPMVSHFAWIDDERMLVYCQVRGRRKWIVVATSSRQITEFVQMSGLPDGHPTWLERGKVLCDTYPDLMRMQRVYVAHSGKVEPLFRSFRSEEFTGEWRCDLHPRFDSSTRTVILDDVDRGSRVIRTLSI